MTKLAVSASGLGKSYRISHDGDAARYRTLRESLVSMGRRAVRREASTSETIWALRDVSFDVERGEAVGIIGRNGAGKSTLLKLLSRITRPTEGSAEVYGRMGSLLEIGTGMHPELTGRENVYLNGAILGMSRAEISRRFDEIVAFAEMEQFLDTPVKRYSTGMHTRLAFAVAAHLDTEILVVDEVLAVGDRQFQEKCLGKMGDAATEGRTVLFVSHNMAAISQLCTRAILLAKGRVELEGPSEDVAAHYTATTSQVSRVDLRSHQPGVEPLRVAFDFAELRDDSGALRQEFSIGEAVTIVFGLQLPPARPRLRLAVGLKTGDGIPLVHACDHDSHFDFAPSGSAVKVRFDDIRFYPGTYYLTLFASDGANTEVLDIAEDVLRLDVVDGGRLTARTLPRHHGLLFLTPEWSQKRPIDSEVAR